MECCRWRCMCMDEQRRVAKRKRFRLLNTAVKGHDRDEPKKGEWRHFFSNWPTTTEWHHDQVIGRRHHLTHYFIHPVFRSSIVYFLSFSSLEDPVRALMRCYRSKAFLSTWYQAMVLLIVIRGISLPWHGALLSCCFELIRGPEGNGVSLRYHHRRRLTRRRDVTSNTFPNITSALASNEVWSMIWITPETSLRQQHTLLPSLSLSLSLSLFLSLGLLSFDFHRYMSVHVIILESYW